MATAHPRRSGAQVLIDQLRIHGTETIFGVPGESYLAALDALYAQRNSIRYVICRQEGGASYMAEAYGKLTGKPGICFVTRGPGATNACGRNAYRLPGFDAHDPADRPGGARDHGPRGVPGDRLPPHVRPDGQVGGPDRGRPAHSRAGEPGLPHRAERPARAGGAGAARGHADRRGRGGRCRPLPDRARRAGGRRHGDAARAARGVQAAAS